MNPGNKIILIDMDGVLADFESAFLERFRAKFPQHTYIPINKRVEFHIHKDYPKELQEDVLSIYTSAGFFQNLPAIDGAVSAVKEIEKKGHYVYFCTTSINQYVNCVLEKYKWIEQKFGYEWTKKIILTKDKTLVYGDILIDDKPEHTGSKAPSWAHHLYDAPYNRHVDDKPRLTWKNWEQVLV